MAAETLHEEEAEEEWRSSSKNQDAVPETRTIRKLGPVLGRQQLFVVRIRLAVGERLSFCCTRPLSLWRVFQYGWRREFSKVTVSPAAVSANSNTPNDTNHNHNNNHNNNHNDRCVTGEGTSVK